MKAIRGLHSLAVLAAVLCAAAWAGGAGQADQNQAQQPASEGWHRFGTGDTPQPAPSVSSGWRYFGTHNASSKDTSTHTIANATPASAKASPPLRPASIDVLEHEMYGLINRDRLDPANAAETGGQAQALRWNPALAAAARAHSRDMQEQHFFAHVDREGRSPGTRVKAAGIEWQAVGENIAIYDSVRAAQTAFMNEPRFGHNHRSNVLDSKYTDVGVGIVKAPDGRYYITQEFVETPRDLRASFSP
jgi:uncharacterized protein YkwD